MWCSHCVPEVMNAKCEIRAPQNYAKHCDNVNTSNLNTHIHIVNTNQNSLIVKYIYYIIPYNSILIHTIRIYLVKVHSNTGKHVKLHLNTYTGTNVNKYYVFPARNLPPVMFGS